MPCSGDHQCCDGARESFGTWDQLQYECRMSRQAGIARVMLGISSLLRLPSIDLAPSARAELRCSYGLTRFCEPAQFLATISVGLSGRKTAIEHPYQYLSTLQSSRPHYAASVRPSALRQIPSRRPAPFRCAQISTMVMLLAPRLADGTRS